jgi:hypothetical protein
MGRCSQTRLDTRPADRQFDRPAEDDATAINAEANDD